MPSGEKDAAMSTVTFASGYTLDGRINGPCHIRLSMDAYEHLYEQLHQLDKYLVSHTGNLVPRERITWILISEFEKSWKE
jgi:hypothetical protein